MSQLTLHNAPAFLVPNFLWSQPGGEPCFMSCRSLVSVIVVFAVVIASDPPPCPSCIKRFSQWFLIVPYCFVVLRNVADQSQQHLVILQTFSWENTENTVAPSGGGLVFPSQCQHQGASASTHVSNSGVELQLNQKDLVPVPCPRHQFFLACSCHSWLPKRGLDQMNLVPPSFLLWVNA